MNKIKTKQIKFSFKYGPIKLDKKVKPKSNTR